MVPMRWPTVITTERLPRAAVPCLQSNEVSESHSEDSHPVSPIDAVADNPPKLPPATVTDPNPVVRRLVVAVLEVAGL
eukprot:658587-Rhodomonas_salina.1